MSLPLVFSENIKTIDISKIILAGDVGGTKTNLALYTIEGNNKSLLQEKLYKSKHYKSFADIVSDFLNELPLPEAVCIGVAGPVLKGKVKLTNLPWDIDTAEIAAEIGIAVSDVHLINDLEATAYGLAMLTEKDIVVIHKGCSEPVGNVAVIAPGTGLGEAGLFWDGKFYNPFATEGGHCDFAPRHKFDFELYEYLQNKFGHVCWERMVCGLGIFNIYQFLRDVKKREEQDWLAQKISEGDPAAVIGQNIEQSAICKETMQLFIRFLAYESSNLVLKFKATGGLFIGGGIAPQLIPYFEEYLFRDYFCSSGRMDPMLESVPVKIILNTKTALLGAAYYAANN